MLTAKQVKEQQDQYRSEENLGWKHLNAIQDQIHIHEKNKPRKPTPAEGRMLLRSKACPAGGIGLLTFFYFFKLFFQKQVIP